MFFTGGQEEVDPSRYLDSLQDIAEELVRAVDDNINSDGETAPSVDTHHLINLWAFESAAQTLLNKRSGILEDERSEDSKRITKAVKMLANHARTALLAGGTPSQQNGMSPEYFKEVGSALETMNQIMKKENATDFISSSMTEDGMVVAAGINATAHALGFLLQDLATNPEKQNALFAEIDAVTDGSRGHLTEAQIRQMKYLEASVRESARIRPGDVLGSARVTTLDCVIGGYDVPKGTILIQVGPPGNDLEAESGRENKFLLERWLKETGRRDDGGPANLEIYLAAIQILQKYRLEYRSHESRGIGGCNSLAGMPVTIRFRRRNSFFHAFPYELSYQN